MDADVGCRIGAVNRFRLQRSVMIGLEGGVVFLGGTLLSSGFVLGLFLLCCLWRIGEDVPTWVN